MDEQDSNTTPNEQHTFEVTRRTVVETGTTALLLTVLPRATFAAGMVDDDTTPPPDATAELRVNGRLNSLTLDPRTTLLDCIRETVALTGTKKGCDHGQCGACTVHVNGKRVLSCLNLALMHDGEEITTVEGLGTPDAMHPMQASFLACDAYQCGYCTSGQIMSAVALLKEPCGPDDASVKELMSGNICRCGAYANIVEAT